MEPIPTGSSMRSARPINLGTRSARGFLYLLSGTLAAKLISFVTQIALAYLLSEGDWGVVGLAYTVTTFIQVIEQAGVGDVLIQRRRFRLWAVPAFWLALALGTTSTVAIAFSGPVAATLYGNDLLVPILLVLAPGSLFNALTVVPRAQLSRELRFRAMAGINVGGLILRMSMTVFFAWVGFGPFAFVVPVPITSAATAAFLWWWVRAPWSIQPRLRRWRYLIGDSTRILVAEVQRAILDQSDYMLLGLVRSIELVGVYLFGFTFSIQILHLLSSNLMNILFPAFTKLNDRPEAQFQAFLKAQRILAMVGVSSCLLQAAVARPMTLLVLPSRWEPSIIVMEILSIGMALRMIAGSSYALLKSQGRFRAILWNRWGFVVLQVLALTFVLALGGGVASVAAVVASVASLIGPITFYTAVRPYGAGWSQVADVLVRPVACGLVAAGTAWLAGQGVEAAGYGHFWQLTAIVVVGVGLNAALARLVMRPVWNDLWTRLRRLMPTRGPVDVDPATNVLN